MKYCGNKSSGLVCIFLEVFYESYELYFIRTSTMFGKYSWYLILSDFVGFIPKYGQTRLDFRANPTELTKIWARSGQVKALGSKNGLDRLGLTSKRIIIRVQPKNVFSKPEWTQFEPDFGSGWALRVNIWVMNLMGWVTHPGKTFDREVTPGSFGLVMYKSWKIFLVL